MLSLLLGNTSTWSKHWCGEARASNVMIRGALLADPELVLRLSKLAGPVSISEMKHIGSHTDLDAPKYCLILCFSANVICINFFLILLKYWLCCLTNTKGSNFCILFYNMLFMFQK